MRLLGFAIFAGLIIMFPPSGFVLVLLGIIYASYAWTYVTRGKEEAEEYAQTVTREYNKGRSRAFWAYIIFSILGFIWFFILPGL